MTNEFELAVLGASLGLAALSGYVTEKLRLGSFVGAIIVGMIVRMLSPLIGVDLENEAWLLLLLSAMFIVFESGRVVGESGFESILIYAVLIEIASILGLTFLITAPLHLDFLERIALAVVLFSSSTTTIYLFAKNLRLSEAKSIALSWTILEDIALIIALSMILGYPELDPLALLVLSTALALIASFTLNLIFNLIPPRGPYGLAITVSLMISYGMIAGYFASPYLGVFIVGYIFARHARGESVEQFSDIAVFLYGMSVGLLTPLENLISSPITVLLVALATLLTLTVRLAAVFLASLLILRSTFYSTMLALSLQNISELTPLVALTLEKAGLIREELASVIVLLPVLTIAISNATSAYWSKIATILNKHLALKIDLWLPRGFYEIGVKLLVTSSKITMVFLGIFIANMALIRFEVTPLALVPVLILGGILIVRLLRELSWELRHIHGLPAIIAETLTVLAAGSLSIHVAAEIFTKYVGVPLAPLLLLIGIALVAGIIAEILIVTKRLLAPSKG